ncbi:MAG: YlbF family regulator, partial [Verrucomicrobiales bacterium]
EGARNDYESLLEKGDVLHQKQHQGVKLSQAEISDYETHRDRVVNNPVAGAFLKAQEEVSKVQETVGKMLAKSFELGRVPEADELSGGSCGTGCGCH